MPQKIKTWTINRMVCMPARSQHHQKKYSRQWNNRQQYKVEVVKRNGGQHDNLLSGHYFMVSIYQVRSNSNITSPASVPVFGCSVRLCYVECVAVGWDGKTCLFIDTMASANLRSLFF